MAITTGPQIDMNQIHVEAGGGSGTQCALNDTDIRDLISKGSGVQMAMSEWYGASAMATFNGTVAASQFENFDNFKHPDINLASDGSSTTGMESVLFTPSYHKYEDCYLSSAIVSPGWTNNGGVAPAADFHGKTIVTVRSLSLRAVVYANFKIDILGDVFIPNWKLVVVDASTLPLVEVTETPVIQAGSLGQTSPITKDLTYDFYPTKSTDVTLQITEQQAKDVISGGLAARWDGNSTASVSYPAPEIMEFHWIADFDYIP